MSNPSQPPGANQANALPGLLRPAQIAALPNFDAANRAKLESAVQQMWSIIESKPADSPEYRAALGRLQTLTQQVKNQFNTWKLQRQQQPAQGQTPQQAQNQGQAAQNQAQGQAQQQPRPTSQGQQPAQMPLQQPAAQPAQTQRQQAPPGILQHIQSIQYVFPADRPAGTPEGNKWLEATKNAHIQFLMKMENAKREMQRINALIEQRKAQGQDFSDLVQQRQAHEHSHNSSKASLDKFRHAQAQMLKQRQQTQAQAVQQAQSQQAQSQQAQAQSQAQQQPSQPAHAKPQTQTSQSTPAAQQAGTPTQGQGEGMGFGQKFPAQGGQFPQGGSAGANPALDAARNASNIRTSMSPTTTQAPTQAYSPTMSQAQSTTTTTTAGMRPSLNTQQPVNRGSPMGAPNTAPIPLTHHDAVAKAGRAYSNPQPSNPVSGLGYNMSSRDNTPNPRMPIPKTLPPNAVQPPTPISMGGPPRPTMGGPNNGIGGVLNQPAVTKTPMFNLEADGGSVLSKKKLDELVRQVTGGGDGAGGEALTPEVEEVMLMVADEFVDNVVAAACRLAKLRESPFLEIRDIQVVLERNYNIRIPGYAMEEVRSTRKFHPAAGWTHKMNAVQAAKVMGGKTDI